MDKGRDSQLKNWKLTGIRCVSLIIFCLMCCHRAYAEEKSFAVVELFTSEGCSSCPPADQILIQLTDKAKGDKRNIFTLSFHVDYWNDLGWRDPFSRSQFTDRQYEYARRLNSTSVYTPQILVNGKVSQLTQIEEDIDHALTMTRALPMRIAIQNQTPKELQIEYELSEMIAGGILHLALVERGLSNVVTRGENAGRTLKHDHVVRFFSSRDLTEEKGTMTIPLSALWDLKNCSIIVYVQNAQTMKILTAHMIDL